MKERNSLEPTHQECKNCSWIWKKNSAKGLVSFKEMLIPNSIQAETKKDLKHPVGLDEPKPLREKTIWISNTSWAARRFR